MEILANSVVKMARVSVLILVFALPSISQEIASTLLKNAHAVILSESNEIVLNSYKSYTQRYSRRVKVLNKKAEHLQSIAIHYKKGTDKIDDINIIIYDKNGEKIKSVKSKELDDYASSDGFSMITDYRVKHYKYNSNKYPITIAYSYTKKSNTTLSLPTWSPIPSYNVAVVESKYKLATNQEVRSKQLNLDSYQTIIIAGKSFTMNNQPALNKEKYSEPQLKVFPAIVLNPKKYSFEGHSGEFDTWAGYGKWIYDSFLKGKRLDNEQAIKEELSKLISPADTKLVIAQKIYDFVQENTRYVSIALDEGGLNPMTPSKVHDVKYGDCKALSLYMHSLLDLYDIESNYVEVHADADYPIGLYEDFPSSFPGNHIILQLLIEGDTTWVDCTSSKNPFGYLGKFTDDRNVLCINEKGGQLTRTPALSKEQNVTKDTVELVIDNKGDGIAYLNHQSLGYSISKDIWLKDLTPKDQKEYFRDKLFKKLNISESSNFDIEVDESIPSSNWKLNLEIEGYAEVAGDYVFISNQISPMDIPVLPKDGNRESDIHFPRAYSQISLINIKTDGDANLIEIKPVQFESSYGRYTKEILQNEDAITVKRTFALNKNTYSKEEYKQIKSFFDRCIKSDREQTTIQKQ